jgi:hypothetical protein
MKFSLIGPHLIAASFVAVILQVGCSDEGPEPSPPGLSVSQTSVTLVQGDSITLTISGGTAPYSLASQGNSAVTQSSVSGNSLKIRAVGTGTSAVVAQDNSSPAQQVAVNVTVTSVPVSFGNDVQPIFTNSCVNAGCHPGGGAPFSLAAGQSYADMVNVQATAGCTTEKRVLPGNAASSVLYKRVSGSSCGSQMPFGAPALSAADIQRIADWINQGALNN